jgi:hypothetical protein
VHIICIAAAPIFPREMRPDRPARVASRRGFGFFRVIVFWIVFWLLRRPTLGEFPVARSAPSLALRLLHAYSREMPPKASSSPDEPDYLSPSFDPHSLTVSKLRGVLFQVSRPLFFSFPFLRFRGSLCPVSVVARLPPQLGLIPLPNSTVSFSPPPPKRQTLCELS